MIYGSHLKITIICKAKPMIVLLYGILITFYAPPLNWIVCSTIFDDTTLLKLQHLICWFCKIIHFMCGDNDFVHAIINSFPAYQHLLHTVKNGVKHCGFHSKLYIMASYQLCHIIWYNINTSLYSFPNSHNSCWKLWRFASYYGYYDVSMLFTMSIFPAG